MAAISTIVIGGAVLGAAAYGSIAQAREAKKMRESQEQAARLQYEESQKLIAEQREEKRKMEEEKANAVANIRGNENREGARKQKGITGSGGLKSTVLTSPLGVQGDANTGAKTLLGT